MFEAEDATVFVRPNPTTAENSYLEYLMDIFAKISEHKEMPRRIAVHHETHATASLSSTA